MKLKLQILLAVILGLPTFLTLGVSAINSESASDSISSFEFSAGSDSRRGDDSSSCSEDDSGSGSELVDVDFVPCKGDASVEAPEDAGTPREDSEGLGNVSDEATDVELIPWWKLSLEERRNAGLPLDGINFCADFSELLERLRVRQRDEAQGRANGDNALESVSRRTFWVNKKLPSGNVNLRNKWVGDGLPSGAIFLLPDSDALYGHSYTVTELKSIILDETNWEPHRGMQSTTTGVCTESVAKCSDFDSYVRYLRDHGVTVRN